MTVRRRRLICTTGGSNKFWEAWTFGGERWLARYGAISSKVTNYHLYIMTNTSSAEKISEKLNKGYVDDIALSTWDVEGDEPMTREECKLLVLKVLNDILAPPNIPNILADLQSIADSLKGTK